MEVFSMRTQNATRDFRATVPSWQTEFAVAGGACWTPDLDVTLPTEQLVAEILAHYGLHAIRIRQLRRCG